MATSKAQRIGIWVIAVVMAVGTIGSFFVIILANDNAQSDQVRQQEQIKEMIAEMRKSNKPLEGFEATPFDKAAVTELGVEVITQGEGEELLADSKIKANYFGWMADGTIFDSTNQDGTVEPREFGLGQVIEGWTKGLTGVRVGSTVLLTIPAAQAYGETDTGMGQPYGPLKFIVEVKEIVAATEEKEAQQ